MRALALALLMALPASAQVAVSDAPVADVTVVLTGPQAIQQAKRIVDCEAQVADLKQSGPPMTWIVVAAAVGVVVGAGVAAGLTFALKR